MIVRTYITTTTQERSFYVSERRLFAPGVHSEEEHYAFQLMSRKKVEPNKCQLKWKTLKLQSGVSYLRVGHIIDFILNSFIFAI